MKFKTRRYYIYYLMKIGFYIGRYIPLGVTLFIAGIAGKLGFRLLGKYRRTAVGNLNRVFSDDRKQNSEIAERVFENLCKNGAEWLKMAYMSPEGIKSLVTEVEGIDILDKALEKGKGAIFLAAHFGNWELISAYIRSRGYPGTVIAKRIYFYKYNKLLERIRNQYNPCFIYRDESPKKILQVLKDNSTIGILADQDVDSVEGVFVDFFGTPAYTPTAPVKLAMVSGASFLPVFMIRKPDNTHRLIIESPIEMSGLERTDENIKHYTQAWTDVLEKYVRQYPDQWVWLHRRWKTKA